MDIEGFLDLARKRRSIRRFKPDPVPDEYIDKVLEAGRWAMSGGNGQPCEFVVVKKPELRYKIAAIVSEQRDRENTIEQTRVEELRHPVSNRPVTDLPAFKGAPVIIVVCSDQRTYQATALATHFYPSEGDIFHMNAGNVTHNLHLAAAALGLGAQWVSIGLPAEAGLKKLLRIPEIFRVFVIVPVGYAADEPPAPSRRELREIKHHDEYDLSRYRSDGAIVEFIKGLRKKE